MVELCDGIVIDSCFGDKIVEIGIDAKAYRTCCRYKQSWQTFNLRDV